MSLGDIVDKLHDDDGLADTGSAERADFATLGEGTNEVDNFDSRLEDVRLGILLNRAEVQDDESDTSS